MQKPAPHPPVGEKTNHQKKSIWAHPAIIASYLSTLGVIVAAFIGSNAMHQQSLVQKQLQQQLIQQQALQQKTSEQQGLLKKTTEQQTLNQKQLQQKVLQQQGLLQKTSEQQGLLKKTTEQQTLNQKQLQQKVLQQQGLLQKASEQQGLLKKRLSPGQVLAQKATVLESQLDRSNILLAGTSTAQAEVVRGFLRTDPSYQRLAENCLKLLDHKSFIYTVHLDVINGKYKTMINPKVGWLPPDQYNDVGKLKAAILINWNQLYPQHHATSVDQIIH